MLWPLCQVREGAGGKKDYLSSVTAVSIAIGHEAQIHGVKY